MQKKMNIRRVCCPLHYDLFPHSFMAHFPSFFLVLTIFPKNGFRRRICSALPIISIGEITWNPLRSAWHQLLTPGAPRQMPSSFLRRHVRTLLRGKFSPTTSLEEQNEQEDPPTPSNEGPAFLSQCYLAGIDGRRIDFPEVYCGKTGLDIPCIQLEAFEPEVFATYTGPDGGLTQVGSVRRQPVVRMANLDDEMSISMDGTTDEEVSDEDDVDQPISAPLRRHNEGSELLLGSCSSLLGPNGHHSHHQDGDSGCSAESFDWKHHDERRAFGVSVSLYEQNPLTGVNAGEPIADVWAVVARNNNGILALADGVNWGEGARLAARCAIRGSVDHLNKQINADSMTNTTEVFHELLAAFHSAHALILQEGGMLTTLCVAVIVPARHGNSWVLCVCNVGDSLCFVYNRNYGVREVTLGSHDIDQMRDMRDAGGALGPVDGRNPQLHNLTCSMTFVEEGDQVFITSDGVSDNFDPVVGKFCVIRKVDGENKENSQLPPREPRKISVATKDSPSKEYARNRACAASLPCVDAARRHELTLVRMRDIIANGLLPPTAEVTRSPRHEPLFARVSASTLCSRLIQFATQLSTAKRKTLENPELYKKEKMSKSEQRARRKAVREKIADMPGKLDHASVVCYRVGRRHVRSLQSPVAAAASSSQPSVPTQDNRTVDVSFENFCRADSAVCSATIVREATASVCLTLPYASMDRPSVLPSSVYDLPHSSGAPITSSELSRPLSPYEQLPVSEQTSCDACCVNGIIQKKPSAPPKKHPRGSMRHTLAVDVQWLKRLVSRKDEMPPEQSSSDSVEKVPLRKKLRDLLGSSKNVAEQTS